MKTFWKAAVVTAIGATVMFSAAPAMARVNVDLNIGVPGPVYAAPAPVYVQPAPVYVQPAPVYVRPRPVYVQPVPVYSYGHRWHHGNPYGDRDHDGVPNRYDRAPNNPYRY